MKFTKAVFVASLTALAVAAPACDKKEDAKKEDAKGDKKEEKKEEAKE
jgi:hypothetical protein